MWPLCLFGLRSSLLVRFRVHGSACLMLVFNVGSQSCWWLDPMAPLDCSPSGGQTSLPFGSGSEPLFRRLCWRVSHLIGLWP